MSASEVAPEVGAAPYVVSWLRTLLSVAFVVMVPLLLISTSLRVLVSDRDFLLAGFRDNRVDLTTGLDRPQLERVATAFVAYFQAPPGRLDVEVEIGGARRPLFNERELLHMEDVQALIQLFLRLQVVAPGVVVVRAAVALGVERSTVPLGRDMLLGASLVVGLVLLVGVLSLVDFTELWTRFHRVAFRNDLWQLDPRRDYLIMLFPEPFWFAATLRLAAMTAAGTLVVAALGFFAWRLR